MIELKLALIVVILVFIKGISSLSPSQCFTFDSTFTQWINHTGWNQAPATTPPNLPASFPANSTPYYWLQDQSGSRIGALISNVNITQDDIISASFYRHLSNTDISDRINMSIVFNGISNLILRTPNYDVFDHVSTTCGSETDCCSSYPCNAQLIIVGEVKDQNELVAVNQVGINCNTPPTPPPPPPPSTGCCNFTTDVCGWSLVNVSNGWHWSVLKAPSRQPPFIGYIWVEDASANVSSYLINYVDRYTTFELTYEFVTTNPTLDSADAWFGGVRLGAFIANVGVQKSNFTCTGYDCCLEDSSCSGQFTVSVTNSPGDELTLSISTFCVY